MKRMPALTGTPLKREEWPKLTWNADLVDFEGPLVSLYRTNDDTDALFVWVDCSIATNRWCIVPIERKVLLDYLSEKCSLLDVFDQQETVIVVNIGGSGRRTQAMWVDRDVLPAEYLPTAESYLTSDLATDAARSLVKEATTRYRVGISGQRDIYADDLMTVPKVISQLYSFHYGLAFSWRTAVRKKLAEGMKSWKGGIDSVNLFSGLHSVIPSVHRTRVAKMQMNSPGYIEFDMLGSLLEDVRSAVVRVSEPEIFKESEQLYKDIYKYMRDQRLSGFDGPFGSKTTSLTRAQRKDLTEYVEEFLSVMDWDAHTETFSNLEADPLSKLRALLAYYRRLRQIQPLVRSGKFTFPES